MPEFGMGGQISILGDVYSVGILLLDRNIHRKRPTDAMFGDGISIHKFTARAMPDHVVDIADPALLIEGGDTDSDDDRYRNDTRGRTITRYQDHSAVRGKRLEECLVSVMLIGLSCSEIYPEDSGCL
ncbi:probable LRR receptor-like serine/threonine-protein kinase At3g47570 [Pyrus communis]|uniref:probable LRR receptor-like serine/threonine-protein kinase At3g47570 n=1 Tax=Pyrus communis TaxID=23211 RepID=UPI0035C2417D